MVAKVLSLLCRLESDQAYVQAATKPLGTTVVPSPDTAWQDRNRQEEAAVVSANKSEDGDGVKPRALFFHRPDSSKGKALDVWHSNLSQQLRA